MSGLVDESDQLCKIIGKSLATAKGKDAKQKQRQQSKEQT